MIFSFLVGIGLGSAHLGPLLALPVLVAAVLMKGLSEVLIPRNWFTGGPSQYSIYLGELAKRGTVPDHPWLIYLVQVLAFGSLLGGAGFALVRFLF